MGMTTLGIICIILGILALLTPGLTGLSITTALGILVLVAGIIRVVWAFQAGSIGKDILMLAIGGFTILCGIVLISNPIFASGMLTILLAAYFILDGISEVFIGVKIGTNAGGGWLLFGGIVSILLGLMMWHQFPLSGAWALGILLGIKLFLVGLTMVTLGSAAPKYH